MKTHNIPLESFIPQGKVSVNIVNGELNLVTTSAFPTWCDKDNTRIKSYVCLPNKYKLPFKIDITVKIDSPALYLLVGKGYVSFATGMDNRKIRDILGENSKPNTHAFDNDLQMNEYADISVVYGMKAMWVYIDGKLRCLSRKDDYIKAIKKGLLPEEVQNGFNIALACTKRTKTAVKTFTITEFENEEITEPQEPVKIHYDSACLSASEKPTLEECVKGISGDLQREIMLTNEYLLNDMKKNLNFKRKIEGGYPYSKITYVSQKGLSYKIHIRGATLWHQLVWIRYNTKQEQEKYGGYKKADCTNEALNKLAEESPELAAEIFFRIRECFGCAQNCDYKVLYEYNGVKKMSCDDIGGGIYFKMLPSDFGELRKYISVLNNVLIIMDMRIKDKFMKK